MGMFFFSQLPDLPQNMKNHPEKRLSVPGRDRGGNRKGTRCTLLFKGLRLSLTGCCFAQGQIRLKTSSAWGIHYDGVFGALGEQRRGSKSMRSRSITSREFHHIRIFAARNDLIRIVCGLVPGRRHRGNS